MDGDTCPHCGSEDYGTVNEGHAHACLTCGYDDENGTLSVCPGGKHYRDAVGPCCRRCYKRAPRDLPGTPRWRSRLRIVKAEAKRLGHPVLYGAAMREATAIERALIEWLTEHPLSLSTER